MHACNVPVDLPVTIVWSSFRGCDFSGYNAHVAVRLVLHALLHPAHPASARESCFACRPLVRETFNFIQRPPDLQSWLFRYGLDEEASAITSSAKEAVYRFFLTFEISGDAITLAESHSSSTLSDTISILQALVTTEVNNEEPQQSSTGKASMNWSDLDDHGKQFPMEKTMALLLLPMSRRGCTSVEQKGPRPSCSHQAHCPPPRASPECSGALKLHKQADFRAESRPVKETNILARLNIKAKGVTMPVYVPYRILCSLHLRQGHKRANCPQRTGSENMLLFPERPLVAHPNAWMANGRSYDERQTSASHHQRPAAGLGEEHFESFTNNGIMDKLLANSSIQHRKAIDILATALMALTRDTSSTLYKKLSRARNSARRSLPRLQHPRAPATTTVRSGIACVFAPMVVHRQQIIPGKILVINQTVCGVSMTFINAHVSHAPEERYRQLQTITDLACEEADPIEVAIFFNTALKHISLATIVRMIYARRLDRILLLSGFCARVIQYQIYEYALLGQPCRPDPSRRTSSHKTSLHRQAATAPSSAEAIAGFLAKVTSLEFAEWDQIFLSDISRDQIAAAIHRLPNGRGGGLSCEFIKAFEYLFTQNIDILKRARAPKRAIFTRLSTEFWAEIEKPDFDTEKYRAKYNRICALSKEISEIDSRYHGLLLEDETITEVKIEEEFEGCENYVQGMFDIENKYLSRCETARDRVDGSLVESAANSVVNTESKRTIRLPKVELPKFKGNLEDWLSWWGQFSKINDDETLGDVDKFHYLLQAVVEGSRAHRLVCSYPITEDNYPKVVQALKDRFGDKNLLIEHYIRRLLKLVVSNARKENLPLDEIYDDLTAHLKNLESLGVNTEMAGVFLYPLVESSLPLDIIQVWQRNPAVGYGIKEEGAENGDKSDASGRLQALMDFLRDEVKGAERMAFAKENFEGNSSMRATGSQLKTPRKTPPTVSNLFGSAFKTKCIFCQRDNHLSSRCFVASRLTPSERDQRIKEAKVCFKCLKGNHLKRECRADIKCRNCGKDHLDIFCNKIALKQGGNNSFKGETSKVVNEGNATCTGVNMSARTCANDILLMTSVAKLKGAKETKEVKVLFDTGSHYSYIKRSIVEKLGLNKIGEISLEKSIFGGGNMKEALHGKYVLKLGSLTNKIDVDIVALDQPEICARIPPIPRGRLLYKLKRKKIYIHPSNFRNEEIDILIGSDYFGQLLTGKVVHLGEDLTAVETKLGWTLMGQSPVVGKEDKVQIALNMLVARNNLKDLWELDILGIQDPIEVVSKKKRETELREHFIKNIKRDEDQRYSVALPWKCERNNIPSNLEIAQRRLEACTSKLRKEKMVIEYSTILQEWEKEGLIERIEENRPQKKGHYLPHRPVFKAESRTTPLRPVFDASCRSYNADIRKAFQMITVQLQDQDFLRFLWWDQTDPMKLTVFRHKRVVFGLNCSPFILGAVIDHHLNSVQGPAAEIAKTMARSFYMDNLVTSLSSQEEVQQFQNTAVNIMEMAKMDLREWEFNLPVSNSKEEKGTTTKVLGLVWDKVEDVLNCDVSIEKDLPRRLTKRIILSKIQQVFDPLGVYSPIFLPPKLLLQRSWELKIGWDSQLPEDMDREFRTWYSQIGLLSQIKIPRHIWFDQTNKNEIHVFCDASKSAYAAVAYMRGEVQGGVHLSLLWSKSRLAPTKRVTIPRLELLACVLGARLVKSISTALTNSCPVTLWTDSSTVMAWLKRKNEWNVFVRNRVQEIRDTVNNENWKFVYGKFNPADLPSRGCSIVQFVSTNWWEGPEWLKGEKESWPSFEPTIDEEEIIKEKRKTLQAYITLIVEANRWFLDRRSKYSLNIRIMAWVLRFLDNARRIPTERGNLKVIELERAERKLLKLVQQETFPGKQAPKNGLKTIKSVEGLWCVETKLLHGQDSEVFKRPILLLRNHPLVEQMVREIHQQNGHGGAQFILSQLREKFWIIGGRRLIKQIIGKCVICRRHNQKPIQTPGAALPTNRIGLGKPFEVTGVDLLGPLYLKGGSKVWVALFTCAVYRAVHLEIVRTLEANTFLLALKRFICRRGRPGKIYSDNGTNFSKTNELLKRLDWGEIERESSVKRIQWIFIPPSAPWWGGFWERLVRVVKSLLVRMLGFSKLNYVQLETALCEVESIINNRALSYISEDDQDLIPLTPQMFLQTNANNEFPELEKIRVNSFTRKYKILSKLNEELKQRFRKEYLGVLIQRAENKRELCIKEGDLVLIGQDNTKRILWPVGKIIKLYLGKDGVNRVARVKTSTGEWLRPVQRLFPLEISSEETPEKASGDKKPLTIKTRSGREVRKPISRTVVRVYRHSSQLAYQRPITRFSAASICLCREIPYQRLRRTPFRDDHPPGTFRKCLTKSPGRRDMTHRVGCHLAEPKGCRLNIALFNIGVGPLLRPPREDIKPRMHGLYAENIVLFIRDDAQFEIVPLIFENFRHGLRGGCQLRQELREGDAKTAALPHSIENREGLDVNNFRPIERLCQTLAECSRRMIVPERRTSEKLVRDLTNDEFEIVPLIFENFRHGLRGSCQLRQELRAVVRFLKVQDRYSSGNLLDVQVAHCPGLHDHRRMRCHFSGLPPNGAAGASNLEATIGDFSVVAPTLARSTRAEILNPRQLGAFCQRLLQENARSSYYARSGDHGSTGIGDAHYSPHRPLGSARLQEHPVAEQAAQRTLTVNVPLSIPWADLCRNFFRGTTKTSHYGCPPPLTLPGGREESSLRILLPNFASVFCETITRHFFTKWRPSGWASDKARSSGLNGGVQVKTQDKYFLFYLPFIVYFEKWKFLKKHRSLLRKRLTRILKTTEEFLSSTPPIPVEDIENNRKVIEETHSELLVIQGKIRDFMLTSDVSEEELEHDDEAALEYTFRSKKIYKKCLALVKPKVAASSSTTSEVSFASSSHHRIKTSQDLGLSPIGQESVKHVVFGGHTSESVNQEYRVTLGHASGNFKMVAKLLDQQNICGNLPRLNRGSWMKELKPRRIWVPDIGKDDKEIEILLECDVLGFIFMMKSFLMSNDLTAAQTRFGWTSMGECQPGSDVSLAQHVTTMTISESSITNLWNLDVLGIMDPIEGPNLIEMIPNLMLRFRNGKFGVVADIKKAFLQIEVNERGQRLPALSVVFPKWRKDRITRSQIGASSIMENARMELSRWEHNLDVVSDTYPFERAEISKVLGICWHKREDCLSCEIPVAISPKITKRSILSCLALIYDLIGFLSPILIKPKILLQKAWTLKLAWDDELDRHYKDELSLWFDDLQLHKGMAIPRNFNSLMVPQKDWQIHTFFDASSEAYAAVVFLRTRVADKIEVHMMAAKSRVAPLKRPTIPRLELFACVVGARLNKMIFEALELKDITNLFWSDATTALAWIKRDDQLGTFVGNRVKEKCRLSDSGDWRYVPSECNPADLPSRGCSLSQLLQSRRWEGPSWLKLSEEYWPSRYKDLNEEEICAERKKIAVVTTKIYQLRSSTKVKGELSVKEIDEADLALLKLVQAECFPSHSIPGLKIYAVERILRVKTKLIHSSDEFGFRLPVLLHGTHPLIEQMICDSHVENCHAGVQFLMNKLRGKYWIVKARQTIKKIVRRCVTCRRFSAKPVVVEDAPLPATRVHNAKVFEVVGIDLAGPLYLKDRTKTWVVLFTCAMYRCVHLELVISLSTEDFLMALERFVKRRGRPSTIFSDNGTNFVGANNFFKQIDWERVSNDGKVKRIEWKFIPPTAAWWGGWPMTYVSDEPNDLVTISPSMFLQEETDVEFPECQNMGSNLTTQKLRYLSKLMEELKSRFRNEYLSLLVQRNRRIYNPKLQAGDVVLVGMDNKKRNFWQVAVIEDILFGRDGVNRLVKVKTAVGTFLRPIQKIYPLEISSTAASSRLLNDKEKTAKIQTRSGRTVCIPNRLDDYYCFPVCLEENSFCRRLADENLRRMFRIGTKLEAVVVPRTRTTLPRVTSGTARRILERSSLAVLPITRLAKSWMTHLDLPITICSSFLRRCAFSGHNADVAVRLALHALPHPAYPASARQSCVGCGSSHLSIAHRDPLQGWVFGRGLDDDALAILGLAKNCIMFDLIVELRTVRGSGVMMDVACGRLVSGSNYCRTDRPTDDSIMTLEENPEIDWTDIPAFWKFSGHNATGFVQAEFLS
ncbi:hypothetical protein LAZ67_2002879 [Cordylochernes scorpioides]|uniref:Integrase catalytic domain-containing protein n=1 Tax=Cordylochernes scorpioides TaxID=51811 RepID=A0ABY6K381_9ARAC|nr:hypothetical protein LAZ67_2002879 [Cordylochernes scorpioides]